MLLFKQSIPAASVCFSPKQLLGNGCANIGLDVTGCLAVNKASLHGGSPAISQLPVNTILKGNNTSDQHLSGQTKRLLEPRKIGDSDNCTLLATVGDLLLEYLIVKS